MPRSKMGVTLADLEQLNLILNEDHTSIQEAADALGTQRTYIYRLIERVNAMAREPDLEWREGTRFRLPVEVRRVVRAYAELRERLDELAGYPRVSAGSSAAALLFLYLGRSGMDQGRTSIVRSRHVQASLLNEEIDMALVHSFSTTGADLDKGIGMTALLEWRPVLVRIVGDRRTLGSSPILFWEPGSTGERLAGEGAASQASGTVPTTSFLQALELVRRGIAREAIVPDIYLGEREWQDLEVRRLSRNPPGSLVALYRESECHRLEPFLDIKIWHRSIPSERGAASGSPRKVRRRV